MDRSIDEAEPRAPIFSPDPISITHSQLTAFMRYCERETGRTFVDAEFHKFSVGDFRLFWRLFLRWSGIVCDGELDPVCVHDSCERAQFFPNLRINYAEILLGDDGESDRTAITACHFDGRRERLTRRELRIKIARLATFLEHLGVRQGDRIAVIARNGVEAVIAALATASIGAVFASCAPDMGTFAILSRFAPLEPVVLMGNFRLEPWEAGMTAADRLTEVAQHLFSLKTIIALDDGLRPNGLTKPVYGFADLVASNAVGDDHAWRRFPFNLPLFILFTSGTTGSPKCIMHGAGGTLLEHVKEHRLHCDLKRGDKLFFQTSCAWMMWNWQLTALASGAELVLYDGPLKGPETLWQLVAEEAVTVFGTSPAYLQLCERAGFEPRRVFELTALRGVLSTGSILYEHQYDWVRDHVKALPVQSISGGTDVIGCFVLGNPNLPVYRGEAQCRSLALDVRSLPPPDNPNASIGELICANPFPSRPLGFYGDSDGERFHDAYFSQNPGVWTHGDLIEFTVTGGARIHGRSDGVLKVHGIRVGPAEIYRILHDIEEVVEAMAVEQRMKDGPGGSRMVLLVVLRSGVVLDDALVVRIRSMLAQRGSAALVPARIAQVNALPITHSGKRSEAAARDALNGRAVQNRDSLQNPDCLDAIAHHPALRPITQTSRSDQKNPSSISRKDLELVLERICKEALHIESIGISDNFLEIGADSLAIVNILMEIEGQLDCRLPFTALFDAPTIGQLAAFILKNRSAAEEGDSELPTWSSVRVATAIGPRIRPAGPADVESICQFLHEGFEAISAKTWQSLFNYTWLEKKPNFGFVAVDGETVIGFVGALYSKRRINGKTGLVCNLTSWYVRPDYHGWGAPLLAAALRDKTITFTALTPAPVTRQILKAMGFNSINSNKILFPPLFHIHTLLRNAPSITFDSKRIDVLLNDEHRKIFYDHLPHDCLHAVISDGTEYLYLVAKRRVHGARRVPYSELLYVSAPSLLARHLERIKLAIIRKQRTLAVEADEHLFLLSTPRGIRFENHAFCRSSLFNARELDELYSELVILPI
jgi:acetoacetyl-CoA synthetase